MLKVLKYWSSEGHKFHRIPGILLLFCNMDRGERKPTNRPVRSCPTHPNNALRHLCRRRWFVLWTTRYPKLPWYDVTNRSIQFHSSNCSSWGSSVHMLKFQELISIRVQSIIWSYFPRLCWGCFASRECFQYRGSEILCFHSLLRFRIPFRQLYSLRHLSKKKKRT